MNDTTAEVNDGASNCDSAEPMGLKSFTIFWKENPSRALVKIKTIYATDLETAREAAQLLIFDATNTVAVVLAVVED